MDKDIQKLRQVANRCWELGLNAIPCKEDKSPVGTWTEFQSRMITPEEFESRSNGHCRMGIVTGKVSYNLEVIDIDSKYDLTGNLAHDYFSLIIDHDKEFFENLHIVKTPSNGFHIYFRCEAIEPSTKLARRPATDVEKSEDYIKSYRREIEKGTEEEKAKDIAFKNSQSAIRVLIETRGNPAFIVCPPTPGYVPFQQRDIPTISPVQRNFLFDAARSFNEYQEKRVTDQPRGNYSGETHFEITPWEAYDTHVDDHTITTMLENHSWTKAYENTTHIYFTRPGKNKGISADYHKGKKWFKVWSTSVSGFEPEHAYTPWSVYKILECNGDPSDACKKLEAMGYGKRKPAEIKQLPAVNRVVPHEPAPDLFKHVYIPNPDNRPAQLPAILELDGTGILTQQNIGALIANPGGGKSSAMEAIIAALINPHCDTLGFSVFPDCSGVLYVDNERTNTDVWNSYYRSHKRTGKKLGENIGNITIAGLRAISRLQDRRDIITTLIIEKKPGLVLIDGAGDLVNDTNDLEEAIECRVWLRALTAAYNISIFVTLHPNPNTVKPRGHQGSEICRESESVLLIKNYENDTKLLTTDFEHGKNRNNPKLTTAFRWSAEHSMFMSADFDGIEQGRKHMKLESKRGDLESLAKRVLPAQKSVGYTTLIEVIAESSGVSAGTARRRIADLLEMGIVKKHDDGNYRMIIN